MSEAADEIFEPQCELVGRHDGRQGSEQEGECAHIVQRGEGGAVQTGGQVVTADGIEPVRMAAEPGGCVQFEVQWRFKRPLEKGRVIRYIVGSERHPELATTETRGLFRDRIPYDTVKPGETVLDLVNIRLPPDVPDGRYQLSVQIMGEPSAASFLAFLGSRSSR